eukprot:scaffold1376_cov257-Pinguiococcus_pyrenoidosus.AAC.23
MLQRYFYGRDRLEMCNPLAHILDLLLHLRGRLLVRLKVSQALRRRLQGSTLVPTGDLALLDHGAQALLQVRRLGLHEIASHGVVEALLRGLQGLALHELLLQRGNAGSLLLQLLLQLPPGLPSGRALAHHLLELVHGADAQQLLRRPRLLAVLVLLAVRGGRLRQRIHVHDLEVLARIVLVLERAGALPQKRRAAVLLVARLAQRRHQCPGQLGRVLLPGQLACAHHQRHPDHTGQVCPRRGERVRHELRRLSGGHASQVHLLRVQQAADLPGLPRRERRHVSQAVSSHEAIREMCAEARKAGPTPKRRCGSTRKKRQWRRKRADAALSRSLSCLCPRRSRRRKGVIDRSFLPASAW